jgi:hypothetical protein
MREHREKVAAVASARIWICERQSYSFDRHNAHEVQLRNGTAHANEVGECRWEARSLRDVDVCFGEHVIGYA